MRYPLAAMATRSYRITPTRPQFSSRIDYEGLLEEAQRAAVQAPPGPVLVIAGAGSGKTRTLVFRLAWLLEQGIPPEEILLLTFTNRAAREMLARASDLAAHLPGLDIRRVLGGTFHHVGNRILRQHATLLGYREGFGILDRSDQADLMASCIAELGAGEGRRRFPKAEVVADLHSAAVNTQAFVEEVVLQRRPALAEWSEDLARVCQRYTERKREMNVMDFDDLLANWKELLVRFPEVRGLLQLQSRAILVDEYQDTNRLQGEIVDLMAAHHRNITVVGDDAQSIYSFRGAEFANIFEFPARYPGCSVHALRVNYRSVPEVLELANASIAHNRRQYPKELVSAREPIGMLPAVVPARDAVQQAAFIAQRILELRDEGVPLSEIGVLYRAHAHSMEIQFELSRRGIPFSVRSGMRFFEQAHVKDVVAWLRLVANHRDELAFRRVVRMYPGIGERYASRLWAEVLALGEEGSWERIDVEGLPARARQGWEACKSLWRQLREPALQEAPAAAIEEILEQGYEAHVQARFREAESRLEELRQLAVFARQFDDMESFLTEILLLSEITGGDEGLGPEEEESLTLSSIHRAKGLEWQVVFVAWLAEGAFPTGAALRDQEGEEEERRCFYVASTRAKEQLYLCYPMLAAPRDRERVILRPSRFIKEIERVDEPLFERWSLEEEPIESLSPGELSALGQSLLAEDPEEDGVGEGEAGESEE